MNVPDEWWIDRLIRWICQRFPKLARWLGLDVEEVRQYYPQIFLGKSVIGKRDFYLDTNRPIGRMIAGPPGGGKSNLIRLIIDELVTMGVGVVPFDITNTQFNSYRPALTHVATREDKKEVLKKCVALILMRETLLEKSGLEDWDPDYFGLPFVFIIIDELAETLLGIDDLQALIDEHGEQQADFLARAKLEEAAVAFLIQLVATIVTQGRKVGVFTIAGTQRPAVAEIGRAVLHTALIAKYATLPTSNHDIDLVLGTAGDNGTRPWGLTIDDWGNKTEVLCAYESTDDLWRHSPPFVTIRKAPSPSEARDKACDHAHMRRDWDSLGWDESLLSQAKRGEYAHLLR